MFLSCLCAMCAFSMLSLLPFNHICFVSALAEDRHKTERMMSSSCFKMKSILLFVVLF